MTKVSFSTHEFEARCKVRPKGYREHVLQYAQIIGDRVWIEAEDLTFLARYYQDRIPPEPRFIDEAKNMTKALSRWSKSGFKLASNKIIGQRKDFCMKCSFWEHGARLGLGKCNHEKCGCTKIKWWLATESCPIGKW